MNEKDFERGCFSAAWSEEVQRSMTPQQKKDLATLIIELEDIKKDFYRIKEQKERLTNLLKFYDGGLVTE